MSAAPRGAACGVLLPDVDRTREGTRGTILDAARLAEQLGFDVLWAGEDLLGRGSGFDAPAALAASAAVTERIALGLGITLRGLNTPAWPAKQLTTIDALAGPGRVRLGVGIGIESVGDVDARLDDGLAVLPDLLCGRPVDREGAAIAVHSPALAPAMAQPPPLYVGGGDEPALRRAARAGDVWLPMWLSPAAVAERATQLAEMAFEHGRPPPRTALLVLARVDSDRAAGRTRAEAHLRHRHRVAAADVERLTLLDSIDGAVQRLSEYTAVGVSEILLLTLGNDPLTQYERLAEVTSRLAAPAPTGSAR